MEESERERKKEGAFQIDTECLENLNLNSNNEAVVIMKLECFSGKNSARNRRMFIFFFKRNI